MKEFDVYFLHILDHMSFLFLQSLYTTFVTNLVFCVIFLFILYSFRTIFWKGHFAKVNAFSK